MPRDTDEQPIFVHTSPGHCELLPYDPGMVGSAQPARELKSYEKFNRLGAYQIFREALNR